MNTLLKKMMVALLALGIGQAAWADDVPNFKETLRAAELRCCCCPIQSWSDVS